LRDDVLSLLEEEAGLLSRKKGLFDKFIISENDKISGLKAGKIEKCLGMFSGDDELIGEIDSIDFHITKVEERIAGIIGVKPSKIGGYLSHRKEDIIQKVCSSKKEIRLTASELVGLRKKTVGLLEAALESTGIEIDDLESLARIKASGILKKKL
jgi:hypothetical protein